MGREGIGAGAADDAFTVFFQGAYPGISVSQRLLGRLGTRREPMVLSWRADDTTSGYLDCKDFSLRNPRCHGPTQFVVGAQLAVGRELWLKVETTSAAARGVARGRIGQTPSVSLT